MMSSKKPWYQTGSFCFYCNVDSTELKLFLIVVIGCLVLATVLVGVGAYLRGSFSKVEEIKNKVLEIEEETYEHGK